MIVDICAGDLNFLLGLLGKNIEEDELVGEDAKDHQVLFDKLIQIINKQERAVIVVNEPER